MPIWVYILYIKTLWFCYLFVCVFVQSWLRNWPELQTRNLGFMWNMLLLGTRHKRYSIPFHRAKISPPQNYLKFFIHLLLHVVRIFWKISGSTPFRKSNCDMSKFSIFLVYSCFSNPETLDKIRIISSPIWNEKKEQIIMVNYTGGAKTQNM